MDSSDEDPRHHKRGVVIAIASTAILLALIGFGLWRMMLWLEPGPIELPPEDLRAQPGLQRFVPSSERRLLAKLTPSSDEDEPPVVPADHPFAKTKVTGRVYDIHTQEGIPDAEIRVKPSFGKPKLGPSGGSGEVVVRSRADGSYAIKGLPAGAFDLDVSAPGYLSVETGIQKYSAIEDDDGFDVGMALARAVEGVVLSAAGVPVPGAEVYAMLGVRANRVAGPPVVSDGDGHFFLDSVGTSALDLIATHPNHGAAVVELAASEEPSTVTLRFPKNAACELKVTGPAGPIAGALIRPLVWSLSGDRSWVGAMTWRDADLRRGRPGPSPVRTGADGRAQVTFGPTGGGFSVEAEGFAGAQMGVEPKESCSAEVQLRPAIHFSGTVLSADGQPVEKATIGIESSAGDRTGVPSIAVTDAAGHFELTDIPDVGPFEVNIFHYEHPRLTTTEGSLQGERIYRLEASGRILGKLIDGKRGGPITQYEYQIFGPVSRRGSAVSVSGAFEVGALPEGHYGIEVHAEGYGPGTAEVTVSPEAPSTELQIKMDPAGTIVGKVQGAVVAGLEIGAFPASPDNEGAGAMEALVQADGSFSMNVPAGQYRLILFGHDGRSLITGELPSVAVRSGEVTAGVEIVAHRGPSPDAVE